MVVQPGLCGTWSETPKTGFLTTRLILFLQYLQLDKNIITDIALGEVEDDSKSIIKHCCDKTKYYTVTTVEKTVNGTIMNVTEPELSCKSYCK